MKRKYDTGYECIIHLYHIKIHIRGKKDLNMKMYFVKFKKLFLISYLLTAYKA